MRSSSPTPTRHTASSSSTTPSSCRGSPRSCADRFAAMLHHLAPIVLAVDEHEPSKTPFYIGGGVLAVWAVVLGVMGLRADTFPANERAARGVMGISVLLVAVAIAMALIPA